MIKFTLSSIVGTQSSSVDMNVDNGLVDVEVKKSITLLTGNNSSWFGKDVTTGATILLYVLCCSYSLAIKPNEELPNMNSNGDKLKFIQDTLNSFDNGEYVSLRITSKYLDKCCYHKYANAGEYVEILKYFNSYHFSANRNTWEYASELSPREKVSHWSYLVNSGSNELKFENVRNNNRKIYYSNNTTVEVFYQLSLCSSSDIDSVSMVLYFYVERRNLSLAISCDNSEKIVGVDKYDNKKEIGLIIDEYYMLATAMLDIKVEQQKKTKFQSVSNDGFITALGRRLLLPHNKSQT